MGSSLLRATNLLKLAMSVIPPRDIQWLQFDDIITNEFGLDVPVFRSPITIKASVQAVSNSMYRELGLDFTKNLLSVHANADLQDTANQKIADRLLIDGKYFNIIQKNDWYEFNGWSDVIVAEDKTEQANPIPEEESEAADDVEN